MSLKWKNLERKSKEQKEMREKGCAPSYAAKAAINIAARKLAYNSLNSVKPLFQFSDFELSYLHTMIKKEWMRRKTPVTKEKLIDKSKIKSHMFLSLNALSPCKNKLD